jgi:hypothetical protein
MPSPDVVVVFEGPKSDTYEYWYKFHKLHRQPTTRAGTLFTFTCHNGQCKYMLVLIGKSGEVGLKHWVRNVLLNLFSFTGLSHLRGNRTTHRIAQRGGNAIGHDSQQCLHYGRDRSTDTPAPHFLGDVRAFRVSILDIILCIPL